MGKASGFNTQLVLKCLDFVYYNGIIDQNSIVGNISAGGHSGI